MSLNANGSKPFDVYNVGILYMYIWVRLIYPAVQVKRLNVWQAQEGLRPGTVAFCINPALTRRVAVVLLYILYI